MRDGQVKRSRNNELTTKTCELNVDRVAGEGICQKNVTRLFTGI